MISVEHMQELIDKFDSGELDIRDIIEQSYFGGRADAIDELVRCFENRTEFRNITRCECLNELRNLAYELKEQKNDNN